MTSETQATAQSQTRRSSRTTKTGVVVVDKQDKTRTVAVDYRIRHPKYGKTIRRQTRYRVHDPKNASRHGDLVEIAHCRPMSKTKRWRLVRVVERGV